MSRLGQVESSVTDARPILAYNCLWDYTTKTGSVPNFNTCHIQPPDLLPPVTVLGPLHPLCTLERQYKPSTPCVS